VIWIEELEGAGCRELHTETRWLHSMLRWMVGVFVQRVEVTPPFRTLTIQEGIFLWYGVEVMYDAGVLNGKETIEALSGCVPLHTTSLTERVRSTGITKRPRVGEVPILSSLLAIASTMLAKSMIASTSYLPPPLLRVALSLDQC